MIHIIEGVGEETQQPLRAPTSSPVVAKMLVARFVSALPPSDADPMIPPDPAKIFANKFSNVWMAP